jgi:glycosyltransferase involved in cell wall biosynthesis
LGTNNDAESGEVALRIAFITPHYYPAVRGNAVTVRRIERSLADRGCRVEVHSLDVLAASEIARRVVAEPPELIHAFHGWSGGRVARAIARETGIPYVITLTGTDVHEALTDSRRDETRAVLHEADRLVAFAPDIKKALTVHCPTLAERTVVIPQGVAPPGDTCPGLGEIPFPPGTFTFFLPAGLRPVKQVLFPLAPLAELYAAEPRVGFLLAGPVIDPAYAARVMEGLERYPFAHYLGGVSHGAIGCLYRRADVVLNTSLFEGGMANSLLEALTCGKPVLAADIAGNRSLVKDGVTGLLYGDEEEFRCKAARLVADARLRERLGTRGREYVLQNFPPEREVVAYLELYRSVMGDRKAMSGQRPFTSH